ncbi:hypothetical protein DUI87_23106 [Hirundo rustica rustica]|uniref:DEP domain-containing protein n=1 Tax=Hirundo rustica rustica TaxID=333673 RepID=A0A3M0JIG3_HIRRU|nr:hypothetical protein DUI87_23106 [Hirundo rustica rustica]
MSFIDSCLVKISLYGSALEGVGLVKDTFSPLDDKQTPVVLAPLLRTRGSDIVQWLMKNLSIEDAGEAIHLGSLIAAQGYVFPISDHVLTLKDDSTFYRFQIGVGESKLKALALLQRMCNFAIYLCKRTMQNKARLELADYEAVGKPSKTSESICKKVGIHLHASRGPSESVYGVTEESQPQSPVHLPSQPVRKTTKEDFRKQITFLNMQIERHCLKMSKVAESLIAYTEQYVEYDPFITPAEPSNPWISDDAALWDIEMSKEPSQQRVKRWGFSMDEVLKDPVGRDQFLRFLESEFSSENLRFWLAVQDLKKQPLQDVTTRVEEIWQEFLAPGAQSAINLDSHSYEKTSQNVKDPGRYTYEDAQAKAPLGTNVPKSTSLQGAASWSHVSEKAQMKECYTVQLVCLCYLSPKSGIFAQWPMSYQNPG